MSDVSLPRPFRDLEKFVSEWALPTELERNHKRRSSSMDVLDEFYDAVSPRWGEIMAHLNGVPAADLPAEERRLLELGLTFVEVSNAVERFGQPDVPSSCDASALVTVEGPRGVRRSAAVPERGA